ncbi:MAG: DUF5050 domain-containing protein [Lachnospiraceae bacterium]|nr:DUF5050 domain-containing protein [Lachnospiraceae bacterium]
MKKKVIKISIGVAILAAIVAMMVIMTINNRFRYNEEGAVANTAGNLYNGGLFCEYEGYIYFSNSDDNNSLYRMKSDGTEPEKLHNDSVSYIQVINDYIYYVKANKVSADVTLRGQPYGIYRLEIGEEISESVYNGIVESMTMCGNYIYFQAYDDNDLIQLKKVKVDGEEEKVISKGDFRLIAVSGKNIYFTDTETSNNLKRLETDTDRIATVYEGNYYMPTLTKEYMYYIDLGEDMKLKRISLTNNQVETMDDGRCINYNVSESENVIYYQLENKDDHKLCRMNLDSSNKVVVTEGDCCNIHITKNYTYFYKLTGVSVDDKTLYRVKTKGNVIQEVNFQVAD